MEATDYITLVSNIRVNQHLLPYLLTTSCRTWNNCSDLKILCDSLLSCAVDISWRLGILWRTSIWWRSLWIFQERDSENACGRKGIVEVVEDVLGLPEVVDPLMPCYLWALFMLLLDLTLWLSRANCTVIWMFLLKTFVVVLYLMLAAVTVSRQFFTDRVEVELSTNVLYVEFLKMQTLLCFCY